jgi:hypothetical protein
LLERADDFAAADLAAADLEAPDFAALGFDRVVELEEFDALDALDEGVVAALVVELLDDRFFEVWLPMNCLTPSSTVSDTSPSFEDAKSFTVSTPCCTAGWFQTRSAARAICSYRSRPARVPST